MIELPQPNGETVAVNPAHVSMIRGFETTMSPKRQMTEILFLSGDWRTIEASYDDVLAAFGGKPLAAPQGEVLVTLPAGFRPSRRTFVSIGDGTGTIQVNPDGTIEGKRP